MPEGRVSVGLVALDVSVSPGLVLLGFVESGLVVSVEEGLVESGFVVPGFVVLGLVELEPDSLPGPVPFPESFQPG